MIKITRLFLILVLCLSFLTFSGCFSVENLIVVLSNYYHYGQPNRPEPKVSVEEYKQIAIKLIDQLEPEFYTALDAVFEGFAQFNSTLDDPLTGISIRLNEAEIRAYNSYGIQVHFDYITTEQSDAIIRGMLILRTDKVSFIEKPKKIEYFLITSSHDYDYDYIRVFYYFNKSDYPKTDNMHPDLGNGWFLDARFRTFI